MPRPKESPHRTLTITMVLPLVKELDAYCYLHEEKRSYVIGKAVKEYLSSGGE